MGFCNYKITLNGAFGNLGKCSNTYWDSGKVLVRAVVFREKRAFGNSDKMRSGNARSGKNRSTQKLARA